MPLEDGSAWLRAMTALAAWTIVELERKFLRHETPGVLHISRPQDKSEKSAPWTDLFEMYQGDPSRCKMLFEGRKNSDVGAL